MPGSEAAPARAAKPKWNSEFDEVKVPVIAEWQGLKMSAGEITRLKTGDLLALDPACAAQVQLRLNHVPKFIGRPGTSSGKWAVQLTSNHHQQQSDMNATAENPSNLNIVLDVPVSLTIELGGCQLPMREVLQLNIGSVVQLDKPADAPVELSINGKLIARGEVVVIEERFGVKITEVIGSTRRRA